MTATILAITAFQLYWLKKAYEREKRTLEIRSNMAFRETVHSLQASKLKLDRIALDSVLPNATLRIRKKEVGANARVQMLPQQKVVALVNVLNEKSKSAEANSIDENKPDSGKRRQHAGWKKDRLVQFLYEMDSLQDSVTVKEISTSYAKRIEQQNIDVPFTIERLEKSNTGEERVFNEVTLGFAHPITYRLNLGNTTPYLFKRISFPVLFSLFLIGFTVLSFSLLYSNLLKQKRLAEIKNEFISNITHELKTPIATVSVAIEALRSFNASMDKEKTKEYLDISANELQRLSLLVDKVLKLSMFENKEIELKYEHINMQDLVKEVTSSMRLQFEKHEAAVNISTEGETNLKADRLHLVSVIFNLFDNALKYSNGSPKIDINIKGNKENVSLSVADTGIGVPEEYKNKIFEKFFRVPTGNLHNAKGYGLGLSYVANVVEKHHGNIRVEKCNPVGSKFIITLPKQD